MSKLDRFKSIAQAALEPTVTDDSIVASARSVDATGLHGTERLKGARLIPIDRIRPDPTQPRKHFSEHSLQELAASIHAHGLLQPLTVSYHQEDDIFTIVAGERRYRAASRAGITQLPCMIVNDPSAQERLFLQLVENLQREDISPFEQAEAFRTLAEEFHLKHQQIAQVVGKSRTYVTKTIGIIRIPESIRRLCLQKGITSREHFTLLSQQKSESEMATFLETLAQHGHDVRTARKVARAPRHRQHTSRPFEFRYRTRTYTVQVRFSKSKVSQREIAEALTQALGTLGHER